MWTSPGCSLNVFINITVKSPGLQMNKALLGSDTQYKAWQMLLNGTGRPDTRRRSFIFRYSEVIGSMHSSSKKANKMLHINRNNTENKMEFWGYKFCMLVHPHQHMWFWCAQRRRDMWKGQGQPRGHRVRTAALQVEIRTLPLFKCGRRGAHAFNLSL